MIELTKDKGVIKKVLMSGDDGPKPQEGEAVMINYEGRLLDGTVLELSH